MTYIFIGLRLRANIYCYVYRNCYGSALDYKLSEQLHHGRIKDFFAVSVAVAGVFSLIKGVFLTGIEMRDLPVARLASGISAPLALRLAQISARSLAKVHPRWRRLSCDCLL